ncbi:hypothetical protein M3Y98_00098100 [Aphelenchoides besseyi]|nr:hypothetical protein M3Y98_00098100 [Aphelenchoides besseyi]
MTTSPLENVNVRITRAIEGQPAQRFEMSVNTGADGRMSVQPLPQQVSYHPPFTRSRSMARGGGGAIDRLRSLNFTPTHLGSSARANSEQPPLRTLTPEQIAQLNRSKKTVNRLFIKPGSWDRQYQEFLKRELSQSADRSNRSRTPPPLSTRTARERSRTPVQHSTGRERSITPPPAERTAIATRSDRSISNIHQSFTASAPQAVARPTLARPTVPTPLNRARFLSISPSHSIKDEVVHHSQQLELPRASNTGPLALTSTPKNNTMASSVYATPTEVKPEPLSIQSPSTLISTWDPIETGDGQKGPLYEHVSTVRIRSLVEGKQLITDQQLRVRTHNPNSRFEIVEIRQDGKLLYLKQSNASISR